MNFASIFRCRARSRLFVRYASGHQWDPDIHALNAPTSGVEVALFRSRTSTIRLQLAAL